MILTHLIAFGFWPGAGVSDFVPPVIPEQGGGGGRRRKFKSWDQRERERQEQLRKDREQKEARALKDKFGDLPKELEKAIRPDAPYKRLSPQAVRAYANSRAHDDEEAMALIQALL